MEFRLFGPFEVRDGERAVEFSRPKQRAVLACLALRAGQVVSFDALVEALWGERAPASARSSLQNLISQLRRILGADLLVTRPGGYLLDVDRATVDVHRFEALVEESRTAAGHERVDLLGRALALRRGPPLADLSTEPFAASQIAHLDESVTSVEEDLVDAELELGRAADLVARIEALVERNPLRERPRAQLMLALYRSGRQADALAAYQDVRRVLVDELGIEPTSGLRELEQAILRQDPALMPAAVEPAPAPHEVRRPATVLFAEIEVLAAGEAERTGGRAVDEMRAAAEYHGGSISVAAVDELLAVFMGHEDDPLRAARAALQLRRALDALSSASGVGVEVRTALTTDQLTIVEGSAQPQAGGRAVTLARRLAGAAAAGEIVLDAATAAAGGPSLTARELEPREVRGESVRAFLLDGADTGPQVRDLARIPLVDRERELARLLAVADETRSERRCRMTVVAGDAGIGKSRLAAELAWRVDATVLVGRCVSYGEGATYLPLREAIVQAAGPDPRAAIAERLAGDEYAETVAEEIAELVSPGGGTTSTGEAFWAVRRFLEALAAERPLLLVFDDVHWAEATFLDLVEYLEQWSQGFPVLVVCLTRPELLERRPAWNAHAIALRPLPDDDARELVQLIAGEVAPEELARITELAEGNPLYTEQLVARAAEGPHALDTVPRSLEALISSRVDRLAPGERAVLERAAVVGREFWHGAVLHLSDPQDVASAGRHLLELVRKGLIRPGRPLFPREDGFSFHHVLIRDVVYASIPAAGRSELHERVADWLESQAPDEDELVGYHLEQAYLSRAGAGPPDRQTRRLAVDAGDRLAAAGIRAAKRGDVPAASNLLGRATTLLPEGESVRRDLLSELGLVLRQAGEVELAGGVLDRALAAAEGAGDGRSELRARVELALLRLYTEPEGAADRLLTLATAALPVLERLGDHRSLARAWIALASVHGPLRCQYGACEQAILEAIDRLRRSGWPLSASLLTLAAAYFYGPERVEEGVRGCRELLEETDLAGEANVLMFLAGLEAMRGEFEEARRLAGRTLVIYGRLGWTSPVATTHAQIAATIELLAGDAPAAEAILAESCAVLSDRGDWGSYATQACLLGEALYRQGGYDEAGHWAERSARCAASDDASAQFSWRALQAKVLARAGRVDEGVVLAREAVPLARATDALSQHGEVLLDVAEIERLAGRPAEAAAALREALGLFERKGNAVLAARTERLLAELAAV